MKFLIITHVQHIKKGQEYYGYSPYINEINLWLKHVDKVEVVAPVNNRNLTEIDTAYQHKNINFNQIPSIAFISFRKAFLSIISMPLIVFKIFKVCKKADHIHLRCPGNIGLIGCIVQIFFPKKMKTAKYAGNWDPNAKQPLSYRFQKWILSNTFLTRNIQVLVYGHWKNQSKNIKPFFTATYHNSEIEHYIKRDYSSHLKFVFVGSLVEGKRPLFAVKLIKALYKQGLKVSLGLYGDGILKESLQIYIKDNKLENNVTLHGNKSKEAIKETLKTAHFSILPSKSEGWPKAIAEAMFFGVIPIATEVSCVPFMLDYGNRGVLISSEVNAAVMKIEDTLKHKDLKRMSKLASDWSQTYTLEYFESEIKKILTH